MALKLYFYAKCDTCRKAVKFLEQHSVPFEAIPIVEKPPSIGELKRMLEFIKAADGTIKNLFNTSGQQYRELKISEKIKSGLSEGDALKLLSANGKLIKRPFLISDNNGLIGFKPDAWNLFFRA